MNKFLMVLIVLTSVNSFASDNKGKSNGHHNDGKNQHNDKRKPIKNRPPNPYCVFDVIPLNSPVKESTARFLIKTPKGFDIDEVSYQVKNSGRIFEKPKAYQKINLIEGTEGKELRISVSKLPPGFYQLLVKIKDRKNKYHFFKKQFKDHASFVVDNSLQVKMPDPKINNSTLLGIDSDNDGIRDDVQRWINENFSNKPEQLKFAFKQYAIAVQAAMNTSNNKIASIQTTHVILNSLSCAYDIAGQYGIPSKEKLELREKISVLYLNTKERIEAKLKADANFHGQKFTSLSTEETCNF